MKTIYKYPIAVEDTNYIEMPIGAKILAVQVQGKTPCLWAEVNTVVGTEKRIFITIGTGHEVTGDNLEYIGTYQVMAGGLVFHVYESLI